MLKFSKMVVFSALVYGLMATSLSAQSHPMGPSVQSSNTIKQMGPLESSKPGTPQSGGIKAPPIPLPPPVYSKPVPVVASYLHPGIIVDRDNGWQGSDHLLNLTNNIGIYASIIKPENANLTVTDQQIMKVVADVFAQVNIRPQTLAAEGQPPLPAFEIQLLAYPIEKGYAIAIDGRLFESVELNRFHLDPGMAYQAVTWEKKTLQVGPTTTIDEQILKSVQGIALEFAERYKAYEEIRKASIR